MIARFAPVSVAGMAALVALTVAGCAPTTRDITVGGPGGGGSATTSPPGPQLLNGVERQIRDGKLVIGSGKSAGPVKRRIAVVIGNSAYQHVTALANPGNDARTMAALLKQNGFEVLRGIDINKRRFERLLREAVLAGGPGADIVAFYAGHGFQIGAKNYVVPVDAALKGANDLPFQTVRLRTLLKIMNDRSGRHLTFIDACRNNPFAGKSAKTGVTRSVGGTAIGFSAPWVPTGGFVAYATQPGALAYDGDGQLNSPFTSALLRSVRRNPAASVTATLRRVRAAVSSATAGKQIPTWTSRISGKFAFKAAPERVASISPARAGDPKVGPSKTTKPKATGKPKATAKPKRPPKAPKSAPKAPLRPKVTVDAPMEKVVAVGGRVADKLKLPKTASVKIVKAPEAGTVATIGSKATTTETILKPVPVSKIGAMVYVMPPTQKAATNRYKDAVKTHEIVAEVKVPGKPPETVTVELRLSPDTCDFLGGDWLDLQGVRLYRPSRSFDANRTILACRDSIAREPRNGRFHFLLGKAYQSQGRWQAAVNSYRRAARLGHLRANYALGALAVRVQGPGPIAFNYFQIGANAGDPLAIAALGRLKLQTASTVDQREEAYELLAFAVDLGIPAAMRTLAAHFGAANSPDYDPPRSRAFLRAARSRESRIRVDPPDRKKIREPIEFEGPGGDGRGADPGTGNN